MKDILKVYRCYTCGKVYQENKSVLCSVAHAEGQCCHYGEREISEAKLAELFEVLNRKEPIKNNE